MKPKGPPLSPLSKLSRCLESSPKKKPGKQNSCVVRFIQDNVVAVRRLPVNHAVGQEFDANFNGQKYPAKIIYVGDVSSCRKKSVETKKLENSPRKAKRRRTLKKADSPIKMQCTTPPPLNLNLSSSSTPPPLNLSTPMKADYRGTVSAMSDGNDLMVPPHPDEFDQTALVSHEGSVSRDDVVVAADETELQVAVHKLLSMPSTVDIVEHDIINNEDPELSHFKLGVGISDEDLAHVVYVKIGPMLENCLPSTVGTRDQHQLPKIHPRQTCVPDIDHAFQPAMNQHHAEIEQALARKDYAIGDDICIEVVQPDVAEPEAERAEAVQPEVAEPEAERAEAVQPEVAQTVAENQYFIYTRGKKDSFAFGYNAKAFFGFLNIDAKSIVPGSAFYLEAHSLFYGAAAQDILDKESFARTFINEYCPEDNPTLLLADTTHFVNESVIEDVLSQSVDEEIIETVASQDSQREMPPHGEITKELSLVLGKLTGEYVTPSQVIEDLEAEQQSASTGAIEDDSNEGSFDLFSEQGPNAQETELIESSQLMLPTPGCNGNDDHTVAEHLMDELRKMIRETDKSDNILDLEKRCQQRLGLESEDGSSGNDPDYILSSQDEEEEEEEEEVVKEKRFIDPPKSTWKLPGRRHGVSNANLNQPNVTYGCNDVNDYWDGVFSHFPTQFSEHVYTKRLPLYDYDGPLIVLTQRVCEYAGEKDPSAVCFYCTGLYKRMSVHLRVSHADEERVHNLMQLKDATAQREGFYQLLKEGNFQHNLCCISNGRGYVITARRADENIKLADLIHCTDCFSLLQKKNFNAHLKICPCKGANPGTCSEALLKQQRLVPATLRQTQEYYLELTLDDLRDPARKKLCMADVNIKSYLICQAFKKQQGQSSKKNLRATANLICRYFEPLWEMTGTSDTMELLVKKNATFLQQRIIEFGDIESFYSDSQEYVRKIKNRVRGRAAGQNARSMNPILKMLTGLAEIESALRYGAASSKTQRHTLLIKFMTNKIKWDGIIFPALSLQRKLAKIHLAPETKMPSAADRLLFIKHLEDFILELGEQVESLALLEVGEIVLLYVNLVDAVVSLLIIYTGNRVNEVEALELENYSIGNQGKAVGTDRDSVAISVLTRDVATIGKNNELIYVNIPPSILPAIEQIISLREKVGVNPKNKYIFAKVRSSGKASLEYRNSYPFYHRMAYSCGAQEPRLLTSQGLRRSFCTEAAHMEFTDKEIADVDLRVSHHRGTAVDYYQVDGVKSAQETVVKFNFAHHKGKNVRNTKFSDLRVADSMLKETNCLTGKLVATPEQVEKIMSVPSTEVSAASQGKSTFRKSSASTRKPIHTKKKSAGRSSSLPGKPTRESKSSHKRAEASSKRASSEDEMSSSSDWEQPVKEPQRKKAQKETLAKSAGRSSSLPGKPPRESKSSHKRAEASSKRASSEDEMSSSSDWEQPVKEPQRKKAQKETLAKSVARVQAKAKLAPREAGRKRKMSTSSVNEFGSESEPSSPVKKKQKLPAKRPLVKSRTAGQPKGEKPKNSARSGPSKKSGGKRTGTK